MNDIVSNLKNLIAKALEIDDVSLVSLDYPGELSHGDYTSNIALVHAKETGKNPKELAEMVAGFLRDAALPEVARIEVAGPGFVNIFLSDASLGDVAESIVVRGTGYGKGNSHSGQRIMVEHTQPNPFKEFHIGHLVNNALGESISRLLSFSGAEVTAVSYHGDTGIHVAKAILGMQLLSEQMPNADAPISEKTKFLGRCYALGAGYWNDAWGEDGEKLLALQKERVDAGELERINRALYEGGDVKVAELHAVGKSWSLAGFEAIYEKVGSKFDRYFFESEAAPFGKKVVEENIENGVFEKSDGAVIFRGEPFGLHTRVFLNSQGLPLYEAKELGLAKTKYDLWPYDSSVVVVGSEIREYTHVLLKVMELVFPDIAKKTQYVFNGMLRLPTGKMSSRTGNVVTGDWLIEHVIDTIREKFEGTRLEGISVDDIGVAAIKYSILKQAPGKDIIFDMEKSLSFEGDSGPYLQYTHARAASVLRKASELGVSAASVAVDSDRTLERMLRRFGEVADRAAREYAPQRVATYLIDLASAFNSYYASTQILDGSSAAPYKVLLTSAFKTVMKNGLWLLGIQAPEQM